MASKAFAGVGASFQRESDVSSGQFDAIAEVNNIDGPNKTRATIDVTSLDSEGGYKEYIPSFRDAGELNLDMNFTHDGFKDMNADFESEDTKNYKIVLPDSDTTTLSFAGFVSSIGMSVPKDDKVTCKVTIKISGVVTVSS